MKKILVVIGTRPEAIKMFPLTKELKKEEDFEVKICSSGQHKEMFNEMVDFFEETIDYDLNVMKPTQTLAYITSKIVEGVDNILSENKFDLVLVHGDTTTAFAASLAAFYNQVPVGHVEAGLRSNDLYSPYPEEFNRRTVDLLGSLFFAPTEVAKKNLLDEGIDERKIFVTGNTVIDAMKYTVKDNYGHKELDWANGKKLILMTSHRRENIGEPMRQMFRALKRICDDFDDIRVIYPVHLNPKVRRIANEILGDCDKVHLIEPLNVFDFHNFMNKSYIILTDSGGVQEEAPALDKPVLVMRETTERPEGVAAGALKLVGINENDIYQNIWELLNNYDIYKKMSEAVNPYGDGEASQRIVSILKELK